jgi:sec-independent protein translocase protein TatA
MLLVLDCTGKEGRKMPRIGLPELIIILVLVLVIFGVGRLPQIGGAIGKGMRQFRQAQRGEDDEVEDKKATAVVKDAASANEKTV